ncbi:hypothetical protein [Mesorhizobium sp.]|uniref:hypothetical protein n=1 Tax=Mesorhizobium sp. TaxID=1871066 RepID=UPI0026000C6B|nr:hypothetical protein [Mesorhizobium sp.]
MASTMALNHASRRVMEKIGLNYTRTVSVDWPDPFPGSEYGEFGTSWCARNGTAANHPPFLERQKTGDISGRFAAPFTAERYQPKHEADNEAKHLPEYSQQSANQDCRAVSPFVSSLGK